MRYYVADLAAREVFGPYDTREDATRAAISFSFINPTQVLREDEARADFQACSFRPARHSNLER